MILVAENIYKSYFSGGSAFKKIETKALESVSLRIPKGKTVGLIGESGCGKSTFGKIISKLLPPTAGKIIFDGQDITNLSDKEFLKYRHDIQMVFQDPNGALNPSHKIKFILNECLLVQGMKQNNRDYLEKSVGMVGMERSCLDRYPHELSGGQKQRIAILQAALMKPKLIVADEVVSALDVSVRSQILNVLKEIQQSMNMSYLFISHDLNVVYHMSDYITVMYMGEIVEEGIADDIYHRHKHPYTKMLFNSVLDYEDKNQTRVMGEAGSRTNLYTGCKFAERCPDSTDICKNQKPESIFFDNNHRVYCHRAKDF